MKLAGYIVIAFVSILTLSVGDAGARGPGESGKGGGAQVGRNSGGGMSHTAPSGNRSSFNTMQSSGRGAQGGGYSGKGGGGTSQAAPSANRPSFNTMQSSGRGTQVGGKSGGGTSQAAPSGNRSSFSTMQSSKSRGGQSYKPNASGKGSSFAPTGKKQAPQGRQSIGQAGKGTPTSGQLQDFLKLPKTNVGQTKSGLGGKIGAGVVGAAAGAMALDHFSKGGSGAGQAGHPGKTMNVATAQHIRDNYSQQHNNMFNKNWYTNHPNLNNYYWHSNIWPYQPWNYWWRPAAWAALSSWVVGAWGPPLYYAYGNNFYYDNGFVYLNGQRVASAAEYYTQAYDIVSQAPAVKDEPERWMPLGVFALSQGNKGASNMVMQLAVNKDGVIQGTYFNTENDVTKPIKCMVDRQSQRAVWTFADEGNNAVILETGVYNLTQDQTEVLVHLGKNRTEQWLMVRLKEPPAEQ
ncbi:MAG: hypothetical protein QG577_526 [Thermodesulfobacteriota bacterium]|nr:hypothetical protein [Thermodesulfobacteriota bacterium]